jgi:hypothetical protein
MLERPYPYIGKEKTLVACNLDGSCPALFQCDFDVPQFPAALGLHDDGVSALH